MNEETQFDWQVRRHVYDVAMHRGYPPLMAEISHDLNVPLEKVETALQRLAAGRVLVRRPAKANSIHNGHISIFDPMKYILKLPKTRKVSLPNGQVRFEKTETDYLPVAARIAWFRKDHPYWSIMTKVEKWGDKAVVMKATIKDMQGTVIVTARKKETEAGFPDYIEKAETGAIGRALAMCGYGTLQAPEFDEQDRLADAPVEKAVNAN